HQRGDGGEYHGKELAQVVELDIDLLGRVDEPEQGTEDYHARTSVAECRPVRQDNAETAGDGPCREWAAIFGMQRFRQPRRGPKGYRQRTCSHCREDEMPLGKQHDELAETGGHDWYRHEHHEDERHDFRHAASAKGVAHDRNRDDPCRSRADALHETAEQYDLE